jgi:hypothetical protein
VQGGVPGGVVVQSEFAALEGVNVQVTTFWLLNMSVTSKVWQTNA